jgi:ribosomal protein L3 glutamine methyltransferase
MASFSDSTRTAVDDLHTIRDILRFGVTEFTRAKLTYGHGTARAIDEAAFMLLTALDLPHDELAPWLDCRLTRAEREQILALFARRIATRKPAPYLLNAAYIQGHRFYVDERVIVPRSYIGELIAAGLNDLLPDSDGEGVTAVLDMCTGSGCLAILAALTFPNARVDAVDLSADALDVAAKNVADYGLGDRIRLVKSDLFAGLDAGERFNLIIANPPYVASAEVAAFDAEYRAEPVLAHEGGADGLDVVRRIMAAAAGYLKPGGVLVMEIGTGRERFEAEFATLDVMWLATETSDGEVLAVSAEALGSMATAPKRAKRR